MEDEIWTTKDGQRLKVGEMSEDHVRAALRMVIRRSRRAAMLRAFVAEQQRLIEQDWHEDQLLSLHDD